MAPVGKLKRFLSPSEYESGRVDGVWACVYLAVAVLAIISSGPMGPAFAATLPLSAVVLTTHGVWTLATLAVCALVDAFVFWVVFRGSAHYPRHNRTLEVPVTARRKGRFSNTQPGKNWETRYTRGISRERVMDGSIKPVSA